METLTVLDHPDAVRAWRAAIAPDTRVGLVPTMGALHDGHRALVVEARTRAEVVVVSIFVNPLQFGEATDFEKYPRPIDADVDVCRDLGVDVVFAPTASAMYPDGFDTHVRVGALAEPMEGASRPGHFDGVATVVTKLFGAVRPHVAVFGQKDFQQLAIIRRMVVDLDLGVEIVGAPTVREADGLAMSSRNARLGPHERAAAACLPRATAAARAVASRPGAEVADVVASVVDVVGAEPLAELDYVEVFDPDTLAPLDRLDGRRVAGRSRLALAARVGPVRLIDNVDLFDDR